MSDIEDGKDIDDGKDGKDGQDKQYLSSWLKRSGKDMSWLEKLPREIQALAFGYLPFRERIKIITRVCPEFALTVKTHMHYMPMPPSLVLGHKQAHQIKQILENALDHKITNLNRLELCDPQVELDIKLIDYIRRINPVHLLLNKITLTETRDDETDSDLKLGINLTEVTLSGGTAQLRFIQHLVKANKQIQRLNFLYTYWGNARIVRLLSHTPNLTHLNFDTQLHVIHGPQFISLSNLPFAKTLTSLEMRLVANPDTLSALAQFKNLTTLKLCAEAHTSNFNLPTWQIAKYQLRTLRKLEHVDICGTLAPFMDMILYAPKKLLSLSLESGAHSYMSHLEPILQKHVHLQTLKLTNIRGWNANVLRHVASKDLNTLHLHILCMDQRQRQRQVPVRLDEHSDDNGNHNSEAKNNRDSDSDVLVMDAKSASENSADDSDMDTSVRVRARQPAKKVPPKYTIMSHSSEMEHILQIVVNWPQLQHLVLLSDSPDCELTTFPSLNMALVSLTINNVNIPTTLEFSPVHCLTMTVEPSLEYLHLTSKKIQQIIRISLNQLAGFAQWLETFTLLKKCTLIGFKPLAALPFYSWKKPKHLDLDVLI